MKALFLTPFKIKAVDILTFWESRPNIKGPTNVWF